MAFFDSMKDSLSVAGMGVSQKAKTATESVRINTQIKSNEKMIEKLTHQVGVQCVQRYLDDTNTEYEELFQEIRRLIQENRAYAAQLQSLTATKRCPQCGFNNNASAKFCIGCGSPLSAAPASGKICPQCGTANTEDSAFCVECGTPLNQAPPAPAPAVPTPPIPEPPVLEPAAPEPEASAFVPPVVEEVVSDDTADSAETQGLHCSNCGAPLQEDIQFCTECGAPVSR